MSARKLKRPRAVHSAKFRTLYYYRGCAKGVEASLNGNDDPNHLIAEGSFWTYSSKDLRRLSAWLIEAADYLDAKGVVDK